MASKVDIANVALRRVGAPRIVSFTEDSASAQVVNDVYDIMLEDLLRQHFWNFAIRRQKLARLSNVPAFEFDYSYSVPQDWIRTVSVHPNDNGSGTMKYKEEEIDNKRVILSSEEDVYMRYVARVTDPNKWSADFRNAVSMTLARELAIPLGDSNTLLTNMDTMAKRAVARARSTDGMGSTPEQIPRGTWVSRRNRSRPTVRNV